MTVPLVAAPKLTERDIAAKKALNGIVRVAIKKAQRRIEQAQLDAAEIEDNEPKPPPGWNKRRFRMALDMRKPKKDAPVYLEYSHRSVELMAKLEAAQNVGPTVSLNIGTINVVQPPQYERVVVDVKE